jgi:Asp/Glu/hydantoin racemase
MKGKTLGLLHTSLTLVPVFQELCDRFLPGVNVFNIVDDSLVKQVIAFDGLDMVTARRVIAHIGSAEDAGADHILVTCAAIGSAVEIAATFTNVPVLRVDQPMLDIAVRTGKRIGVVATLPVAMGPTTELLKRRAAQAGHRIELKSKICPDAFAALKAGNIAGHNEIIACAIKELSAQVDVIVLAQASMANLVDILQGECTVPVIASPANAIKYLAPYFDRSIGI